MAHIPNFVEKLLNKESKLKINFRCIEKEARNKNLKGDFELELSNKKVVNFSLKNYNGGIRNMQYQSGTFNSFIMNLFFESSGVGSYIYPHSGAKKCIKKTCRITYNHEHFRGSNLNERDKALTKIGYEKIIPFAHRMDSIHEHMRNDVLRSNTYKFYDETKFNLLRKKTGHDGVDVAFIRTTNSVTIDYGAGRRIQFILRLFDNVSSILNTFDIDCCCCNIVLIIILFNLS
jgi:hypothetical protein